MEYRQKLVDQWKTDSTVRRVAERRHMPGSVHSAVRLKHEMLEARKVKEDRRRKHTKAGKEKPKPERKSEYDKRWCREKWQLAVTGTQPGFRASRDSLRPWVPAGIETRITASLSTGSGGTLAVCDVMRAIWLRLAHTQCVGEVAPGTCGGGAKGGGGKGASLLTSNRGHHRRAEVGFSALSAYFSPFRHIARSLFAVFLLYIACHIHRDRADPFPDPPTTTLILRGSDRRARINGAAAQPSDRLVRYRYAGRSRCRNALARCSTSLIGSPDQQHYTQVARVISQAQPDERGARPVRLGLGTALLFERPHLDTGTRHAHALACVVRARAMFGFQCPCLGLPTHKHRKRGPSRTPQQMRGPNVCTRLVRATRHPLWSFRHTKARGAGAAGCRPPRSLARVLRHLAPPLSCSHPSPSLPRFALMLLRYQA